MKIRLSQLRRVISEKLGYVRPRKPLREMRPSQEVPTSSAELQDMLADAAPPRALDIGDRIQKQDPDRLWQNVSAEIHDGTPWEEIVDSHVYGWLVERGFDPEDIEDMLNHLA